MVIHGGTKPEAYERKKLENFCQCGLDAGAHSLALEQMKNEPAPVKCQGVGLNGLLRALRFANSNRSF